MIADGIVRAFQIIFSAIVLGLSITAIRWQMYGSAPASTGFNAFAGAWGALTGLVGLAAVFVSAMPALIVGLADFLAFVILLAGGIAYAVQIGGTKCSSYADFNSDLANPYFNGLMNGGMTSDNRIGLPSADLSILGDRCNKIKADTAFLFLACIASLAAGVIAIISHRKGRSYNK